MLTVGKIAATPSAGLYYVRQVARGAEDYYAGEGEVAGGWIGSGSRALGLAGEVDADGIVRLLDARDPSSGARLRQPLASGAVAGFDLTFRAPKSVSVLFGIAEETVAGEIRAAHQAAVAEALGYMEREACKARQGRGGATVVAGRGFVAAAFEHRSSRAGDPLLHTHVVVANETQGPDGRWSALDGRLLYQHAKTGGYIYQAVLRAELTERLHLRWHAVERGAADVVGVPRDVIDHFSQRRAEILELMAKRGEHSARAAQIATLETRRRKQYGVPIDRLREDWRARAAEHGLTRFRVRALFGRGRVRDLDVERFEDVASALEGAGGLTCERSTFCRRDVLQAVAEAAGRGARVGDLEARADAFLARSSVVELAPTAAERRYTTRELVTIERELLDRAARRRGANVGTAGQSELDAALAARPELGDEQRELVVALTRSGDGVQVVRAAAGTGKTRALDGAREAWQRSGVAVLGCALSARAACELRDQAGVDATTIARLTYGLEHGIELSRGSVLVVDEAGMVGTRALALDHGRHVQLPASYAHDGHLDHAYATTAHRAQGATVDRTFVLGSDELYREWGYTALSRHRDEARFYVTALPTFLNVAPKPLRDENVTSRVALMLAESRAEHLALHGIEHDHLAPVLNEQLNHANERLADYATRLDFLRDERAETRWHQRGRRAEIDRLAENWQRGLSHWQDQVDRLTGELAERPVPHEPDLWRARDPLEKLDPARELQRDMARSIERARDHGIGLER